MREGLFGTVRADESVPVDISAPQALLVDDPGAVEANRLEIFPPTCSAKGYVGFRRVSTNPTSFSVVLSFHNSS